MTWCMIVVRTEERLELYPSKRSIEYLYFY